MRLLTPDSLAYPVTVTKLLRDVGDDIQQNVALFTYEYKTINNEGTEDNREGVDVEKIAYSTFESEAEGKLDSWSVRPGQVITRARTVVAEIEEPCIHEIQFGGMCANCGKDMTMVAYNTTVRDTARATVNTVHGHTALLVSETEATRSDEEAKRRLLTSRKLSLVVDLDQTIIHATVDPTVAEWQKDPSNPNYDAVKHVRAFQLIDDGPGARGCWYYIKLRPGLEGFLQTISKYYELHIYTMGTRAYAQNIAKIIDPDGKIFADRILSRDESGSLTAKSLKRLFPVDTKMVVIIDDRGDVWHWSPNLIKVSAYDFFVGIGDINSSFLPKRPELETKPAKSAKSDSSVSSNDRAEISANDTDKSIESHTVSRAPTPASTPPQTNGDVSAVAQLVRLNESSTMEEQTKEQDEAIESQLSDRPLMQKQKILDAAEEEAKASPAVEAAAELLADDGEKKEEAMEDTAPAPKYRHNLLQDDDTELLHLGESLRNVHSAFFDAYEGSLKGQQGGRIAELRPGKHAKKRSVDDLDTIPDAAAIMADLRAKVLQGLNLVFSGVVPLGIDPQSHDTAVWAKSFGATISDNVSKKTTHVIASPARRTAKVRQAAKKPRIAIVTQQWLFASFSQWQRVDETPYRIHNEASSNGDSSGLPGSFEEKDQNEMLSSSDEEAALTEEEGETRNGVELTINTDTDNADVDEEELARYAPTILREDSSPTEAEKPDDWASLEAEIAEALGSDYDEDSEAETDSETMSELKTPPSQRKRKRDEAEKGNATEADVAGGEDGQSETDEAGSRLQKRKKQAFGRVTSLTNVKSAGNGARDAAVDGKATVDPGGGGGVQEGDVDGDSDDGFDLEAALEAEMNKQDEEAQSA